MTCAGKPLPVHSHPSTTAWPHAHIRPSQVLLCWPNCCPYCHWVTVQRLPRQGFPVTHNVASSCFCAVFVCGVALPLPPAQKEAVRETSAATGTRRGSAAPCDPTRNTSQGAMTSTMLYKTLAPQQACPQHNKTLRQPSAITQIHLRTKSPAEHCTAERCSQLTAHRTDSTSASIPAHHYHTSLLHTPVNEGDELDVLLKLCHSSGSQLMPAGRGAASSSRRGTSTNLSQVACTGAVLRVRQSDWHRRGQQAPHSHPAQHTQCCSTVAYVLPPPAPSPLLLWCHDTVDWQLMHLEVSQ
jgi:hypothetical protein